MIAPRRAWGLLSFACAVGFVGSPLPVSAQAAVFVHHVTADNLRDPGFESVIDSPLLNARPGALFFVERLFNAPGAVHVYNPEPIAIHYRAAEQRWAIENESIVDLPLGAGFTVWVPPPSAFDAAGDPVFAVATSAANTSGSLTRLDHPLLNGNPNALLQVTAVAIDGGPFVNFEVGLWYSTALARWTIYREDLAAMPHSIQFNVCVDDCFGDAFDGDFWTWFDTDEFNIDGRYGYDSGFRSRREYPLVSRVFIGNYQNETLGVLWAPLELRWAVYTEDGTAMETGLRFHLLHSRGLFASGFESGGLLGWRLSP